MTTICLLKPLNPTSSKHSSPWGWWAELGFANALAASTLGTPHLKSVLCRDILSSLPHMAAPSAPSPGDWAEKEVLSFCQMQEAAGLSQDPYSHLTASCVFLLRPDPPSCAHVFICLLG